MMTAAVRDLHLCYPAEFLTDVRTPHPEIWYHNPFLTPLNEEDAEVLQLDYPLINQSNQRPYHFIHGYIRDLNDKLKLNVEPSVFKGDIHPRTVRKNGCSSMKALAGVDFPYWILAAGGKTDYTTKWWSSERYQEVVNYFEGSIQFVQVGRDEDHHPKIEGAVDLRGRTSLRELILLIYHAQGVLCPVTAMMHLSAAVPSKPGRSSLRPCVVVAGGREAPHWESYPGHQFLHTVGALPCCAEGGCWRSRVRPLNDGSDFDKSLCENHDGSLPKCMDLITSRHVIEAVKFFFSGGKLHYLRPSQAAAGRLATTRTRNRGMEGDEPELTLLGVRTRMDEFIKRIPEDPGGHSGQGIVICAGGLTLFTCAWVSVRMLRDLGCKLPVEIWYLDESELDPAMEKLIAPFGVECFNASVVRVKHPVRRLNGWALKPYSILHSKFSEVLFLDADNVAVANPEYLFHCAPYKRTGVVLWPDNQLLEELNPVWELSGVEFQKIMAFESGQILIDKRRCWKSLALTVWINSHSDFFYRLLYGDKDTFYLALHKLGQNYSRPAFPLKELKATFCQHDFKGKRIFQHRNRAKWNFAGQNLRIRGFQHEKRCLDFIDKLRASWDGRVPTFLKPAKRKSVSASRSGNFRFFIGMTSCPSRHLALEKTLKSWGQSDWSNVGIEVSQFEDFSLEPKSRGIENCRRTLQKGFKSGAEYILFCEDDICFNRHIRHNLENWKPFNRQEINLATLYNPGVSPLAASFKEHFLIAAPSTVYGSQCLLISRWMAGRILRQWDESQGGQDTIITHIAARMSEPIFVHSPSLIQHSGRKSTWGGWFHRSRDFDPNWKAENI